MNGSSNYTDASLRDYRALESYRLRILLVAGGLTPVIPTESPNVRHCWLSGPAARRTPGSGRVTTGGHLLAWLVVSASRTLRIAAGRGHDDLGARGPAGGHACQPGAS